MNSLYNLKTVIFLNCMSLLRGLYLQCAPIVFCFSGWSDPPPSFSFLDYLVVNSYENFL